MGLITSAQQFSIVQDNELESLTEFGRHLLVAA